LISAQIPGEYGDLAKRFFLKVAAASLTDDFLH
jgi:hypothetical protein